MQPNKEKTEDLTIKGSLMLYEALVAENGLQHIVDTALMILDNPVLVSDSSFKIMAHAEKPETDNKMWNQIIKQGFYPADYVYSVTKEVEIYQQIYSTNPVRIITDKVAPNRYMSKMITVNGKPIGFASCIEHESPLTDQDCEIFSVFCKVVGLELRDNELLRQSYNKRYEYFISEMISGSIDTRFIDERIKEIDLKFKINNYIFVLEFIDKKLMLEHQMDYFRRSLSQIIPGGYCISYHNALVVLVSQDRPDAPVSSFTEFLKVSDMISGFSYRFSEPVDMRRAYVQACNAIRMGRLLEGGNDIYDYNQMRIYHMLDLLNERETGNLRQFIDSKLLEVMQYDESYNTKLAYTIYTYICKDKNPAKTSQSLNIHRNTVDYRIKRIKDQFGIDLSNQDTIFSFDLSFRILEYLRELPY